MAAEFLDAMCVTGFGLCHDGNVLIEECFSVNHTKETLSAIGGGDAGIRTTCSSGGTWNVDPQGAIGSPDLFGRHDSIMPALNTE